jgi:hypothetical protein
MGMMTKQQLLLTALEQTQSVRVLGARTPMLLLWVLFVGAHTRSYGQSERAVVSRASWRDALPFFELGSREEMKAVLSNFLVRRVVSLGRP